MGLEGAPTILGIAYLVFVVLGIVLTIAWILMPFAMFGIKPLLRELVAEQRRTNELLRQHAP